jgi:hypothetical protein
METSRGYQDQKRWRRSIKDSLIANSEKRVETTIAKGSSSSDYRRMRHRQLSESAVYFVWIIILNVIFLLRRLINPSLH